MPWLVTVGPVVLVGIAIGGVVAARHLDRVRESAAHERVAEPSVHPGRLRAELDALGADVSSLGNAAADDTVAGPFDR